MSLDPQKSTLFFHRPVRNYPEPLPKDEVIIIAPPQIPKQSSSKWMTLMFPLMIGFGAFGLVSSFHSKWMVWIIGIIIGLAIVVGVFMLWQQYVKPKKERERQRQKYINYLNKKEALLSQIVIAQRKFNRRLYPNMSGLKDVITSKEAVWERRRDDKDFLFAPLGWARLPLCVPVSLQLPEDPMLELRPDLLVLANELVSRFKTLEAEPVVVPLAQMEHLAIRSNPPDGQNFLKYLLNYLATFHNPSDLQIMVLSPYEEVDTWKWLRWLPHNRFGRTKEAESSIYSLCLNGYNTTECVELWDNHISPRIQQGISVKEIDPDSYSDETPLPPHLLVILDNYDPIHWPDSLLERLQSIHNLKDANITFIYLCQNRQKEPTIAKARLILHPQDGFVYQQMKFGSPLINGSHYESPTTNEADSLARMLSSLGVANQSSFDLSSPVYFKEILELESARGSGKFDSSMLLCSPIGLGSDGKPLVLDLKESAAGGMGPHGLVVGATGSGKSELLRTLVTSLAWIHDPKILNFIFIDFKGGAAFDELSKLPHSAGIITNLEQDPSLINRAYDALGGEQQIRQNLLRRANNSENIQQYNNWQKSHPEFDPLPYLLIIVDEFGELLNQNPQFLDVLVSLGRTGRSTGMHLLLSTQRLEEGRIRGLESHLRYRIALRTYSQSESSSAISKPNAYFLPPFPGSAYLSVDGKLTLFKAAQVSIEQSSKIDPQSQKVRKFSEKGHLESIQSSFIQDKQTDLEKVIEFFQNSPLDFPPAHKIWLDPLPMEIRFDQFEPIVKQSDPPSDLSVPVGLIDLPFKQLQQSFWIDFIGKGGHLAICGAPQSGKSSFLRTLISMMGTCYSAELVQCYLIDFGGGSLFSLSKLAHVGGVTSRAQPEQMRALFRQIERIIQQREEMFRHLAIAGMQDYRMRRANGEIENRYGDIFIVVDGFGQLQAEGNELYLDSLAKIASAGLHIGIHLILTSNRWIDIKPKIKDNIGTRLELRLNDPIDSDIGKSFQLLLANATQGRGITSEGLLFQTALIEPEQTQKINLEISKTHTAPTLKVLPLYLSTKELSSDISKGIALGLQDSDLETFYFNPFGSQPHFLIFGDTSSGKTSTLKTILESIYNNQKDLFDIILIDYRRSLEDLANKIDVLAYATGIDTLEQAKEIIRNKVIQKRQAIYTKKDLGPHLLIAIDDYELVNTSTNKPLSDLIDVVSLARDIGVSIVATKTVGGMSRYYDDFLLSLREMGTPGLILSGDPQEGYILANQKASNFPPGRGYLVRRGQNTVIAQVAKNNN